MAMSGNLKVLMCASEVAPFAKTGGLADVVGALSKHLRKLGCDVRVVLPMYRQTKSLQLKLEALPHKIFVPVGIHHYTGYLWKTTTGDGVEVYLIEKDEFFDRSFLYGNPDPERGDYEDNAERFIFFCRAVFSLCLHIDWRPNIFHIHDWQASLVAPYLQYHWRNTDEFSTARCLLTIHNLAFQGIFPGSYYGITHLPDHFFNMEGMEYWGQCNFLKAGIVCSEFITTVSPSYAKQIQTPEYGHGLDGVLRNRSDRLLGILNGIDYDTWDPANDPFTVAPFDLINLSGKKLCKKHLLKELNLTSDLLDHPLCAIIGRMTYQKGYDLVHAVAPTIFDHGAGLVVLGTGIPEIMKLFRSLQQKYPDRCAAVFEFDESLAHRIEAGADIFLMPSRFEPCGLNQMYSLRYGTVPVVYATGGLDDTVVDAVEYPDKGTGFKFYKYDVDNFWEAIRNAFDVYAQPEKWQKIQIRGMEQDFSWSRSALKYMELYEQIIKTD